MARKSADDVYTPTLNRHLLEGAFSQCMHQVLMSLDMCRVHEDTPRMSLEEHVRALWVISKDELGTALMLVDGRCSSTLPKKQRLWVLRTGTTLRRLQEMDPGPENDESTLKAILTSVVQWIQDSHLILHEDTPQQTRVYLSTKDMTTEELEVYGEDEEVPRISGSIN